MPNEALLVRTLVELADNLVDDFDVVELLSLLADRCVDILDVSAAGVMLVAPEGDLRVVASSSEAMRVVELFELQADEGPCPDCYRVGEPVVNADLADTTGPWPRFGPVAIDAGFQSVNALPMRLRGSVIGALNLFGSERGRLAEADVVAAEALAAVATIAILQQRVVTEARLLNDQLNHALSSRVAIEQAKGVLAERAGLSMESAFEAMRGYARDHNLHLAAVARSVTDKTLTATALAAARRPPPRRRREGPA
ncbi:MAG: GAF and ANTAR domain-containing protein [Acidimicrobiales bacterium]